MADVTVAAPVLVGRERELATLSDAFAHAPAVVLVMGEAGIGKSRLVREFLTAGQVNALVAGCPPFHESLTLGPIVDAVRRAVGNRSDLRVSPLAGALRPVFPEWADWLPADPPPLADAKASKHRLFRALTELIDLLGVSVVVLEDAHWADPATLELLLVLASDPGAPSLLVTYRPEDLPDSSLVRRLSSPLRAGASRAVVELEPLAEAGTAELISSMLDGSPMSDEFARFMHDCTDGVPLAVEESVRLMHHKADLVLRDGSWVRRRLARLQVPPSIRDAVLERSRRLGDAAQRVLNAAAVLADPADDATIAAVAGLSPDAARDGVVDALAVGLLGEDTSGRSGFRHALMRQAIYESLPGPVRRDLHAAAARTLEGAAPRPVAALVHHFREARLTDAWCRYAEEAAQRAVAADDHAAAVRVLLDVPAADGLPAEARVRVARTLAVAVVQRRDAVDDLDRQATEVLRAVAAGADLDVEAAADLRGLLGRVLNRLGDFVAAHAEFEAALPGLAHRPAEAARLMTNLGMPVGPWPASVHRRWLRRAGGLAARISAPVDRLGLAVDQATVLLSIGDPAGWEAGAGLPTTAPTIEERRELARGLFNVASAALVWGRHAEADRRLAAARALAEHDRFDRLGPHLDIAEAERDWWAGRWAGLGERAAALAEDETLAPNARPVALRLAGRLHAAHGASLAAEDCLRRALDESDETGGMADDTIDASALLARLALARGAAADAVTLTDGPAATIAAKRIWIWATEIAPVRVEALCAVGRVDDAADLVASFAAGVRGIDAPAARAALATCRGVVTASQDEPGGAAQAFARATRAWDALPRPYPAFLMRERRAECLLAVGRTAEGLDLLAQARAGLASLGASADVDRVARLLRRHGVAAKLSRRGGHPGYGTRLSPREREVVDLVVDGRSNREIAELLGRSPRTVAGQVSSAMRKLDVASRTALAVAAIQRRDPDPQD